eukprot:767745-Hanusia_phi.AAC.2
MFTASRSLVSFNVARSNRQQFQRFVIHVVARGSTVRASQSVILPGLGRFSSTVVPLAPLQELQLQESHPGSLSLHYKNYNYKNLIQALS